MKKIVTYSCVFLVTLLSGCVTIESREYSRYVEVDKSDAFSAEIPDDALVSLRLPPGQVNIVRAPSGQEFRARVSRRCPEVELSECRQELDDMAFVSKRKNGQFILTTNNHRGFNTNENYIFEIVVPTIAHLELDMTAGEVNVGKLNSCFSTDLAAGAVHIEADYDLTKSVFIETSAGETSLKVNGRHIEEDRFLMHSKTVWHKGDGVCDLKVDVSAGQVSVKLI